MLWPEVGLAVVTFTPRIWLVEVATAAVSEAMLVTTPEALTVSLVPSAIVVEAGSLAYPMVPEEIFEAFKFVRFRPLTAGISAEAFS